MTATIAAPFDVRRFAGNIWIVVLVAVAAALVAGSFVLGRVTGNDNGSTIAPVRTVYLQHTAGDSSQSCHVHTPC